MSDTRTPRTVLVTGSGTGVGRSSAIRFAQMGFNVVVNYSRSSKEAEETLAAVQACGVEGTIIQCDVSSESAVSEMFQTVDAKYGRLDVLVNNAARTSFIPGPDLEAMTEDKWDEILSVNLKGTFFCVKHAVPLLRKGKGGKDGDVNGVIVNVTSIAGQTGRGSCIAYSASKGALNTMTKSLAIALAPDIRVNAVLPGPIDSRWIREGDNDWDLSEMTADFPIPRASTTDEIADGIIYLATGTTMTTGHLLLVDGGQAIR